MKIRKYSLVMLGAGLLAVLHSFVVPLVLMLNYGDHNASIGIIGGADGPTAQFLTLQLLASWRGCVSLLGAALFLSGLFCLIFSKTVARICTIQTSAIALGLSASGGVGLYCFFVWLAMSAFHETGKHPIAYPVSVVGGILCLMAFAALLALYFRERRQKWSWGGLAIDAATAILYLPVFLCGISCIHEWLSRLGGR